MKPSTAGRDFILGLLFFGSIAFLIYSTVALSGFSFKDKYHLEAFFPNAKGLKAGDSVLVSGRVTGSVTTVEFLDAQPDAERIRVVMEFKSPITLYRSFEMRINEFTFLGGRVVEINPGSAADPVLGRNEKILGAVGPSALDSLAELVEDNREELEAILRNVRDATEAVNKGEGILGALIYDPELRQRLTGVVDEVSGLIGDIRGGEGTIGMLLNDEVVRDRVIALIENGANAADRFRIIAEDLAAGRGTFGALLKDEEVRGDTVDLISNLADSAAGLRSIVEEAQTGEGLLARILSDPELAEDVANFMNDLALVTNNLASGQGTLGKFLAEDEVYGEVLAALQSLNAQLEDAREAQPISSFAGLLFQGF